MHIRPLADAETLFGRTAFDGLIAMSFICTRLFSCKNCISTICDSVNTARAVFFGIVVQINPRATYLLARAIYTIGHNTIFLFKFDTIRVLPKFEMPEYVYE